VSGQSFDFSGEIPIEIRVESVAAVQAEIAAHEAARPDLAADYARIWLKTFYTPAHKAVAEWGRIHGELKDRLAVARAMEGQRLYQAAPKPSAGHPKKTIPDLVQAYCATVAKMLVCQDPKQFNTLRTSASNTKKLIGNRKGESNPWPDLPEIPKFQGAA